MKVFWSLFCGVFTHLEFVSSFFSSFPLVLFHYISDLGHVIGRCSAYLLTYSDSRRLLEIVSHKTLVKNEQWDSLPFRVFSVSTWVSEFLISDYYLWLAANRKGHSSKNDVFTVEGARTWARFSWGRGVGLEMTARWH